MAEKSVERQQPQQPETFTIIAGPCVLEGTDGQLNLDVALALKQIMSRLSKRWQLDFYFKSSYDKANRTSNSSYRGPGLNKGLEILESIKQQAKTAILTDIHNYQEAPEAAQVADMLQIPAFLCRQTDLLTAAGETGKKVNIKKGQFLSPHDMVHAAKKVQDTGNNQVYITERGTTFGYNNLVVDMRSIPIIQSYDLPLIFDATHSVQLPGGQGTVSGGQRQYVNTLARAAVAAGCNGLFFETHPDPDRAPSDGPNMLPLAWIEDMLTTCLEIRDVVNPKAVAGIATALV